jgi:hypothetical protein
MDLELSYDLLEPAPQTRYTSLVKKGGGGYESNPSWEI